LQACEANRIAQDANKISALSFQPELTVKPLRLPKLTGMVCKIDDGETYFLELEAAYSLANTGGRRLLLTDINWRDNPGGIHAATTSEIYRLPDSYVESPGVSPQIDGEQPIFPIELDVGIGLNVEVRIEVEFNGTWLSSLPSPPNGLSIQTENPPIGGILTLDFSSPTVGTVTSDEFYFYDFYRSDRC
jgi:hypothetical protein